MPERYLLVRWPDGAAQRIYSPSTIVENFFAAGARAAGQPAGHVLVEGIES